MAVLGNIALCIFDSISSVVVVVEGGFEISCQKNRHGDPLEKSAAYLHIKGSFNQGKCYYIVPH